jgi:hypothetical protein
MALKKIDTPYSALRAASRLPPVQQPVENPAEPSIETAAPTPVERTVSPAKPDTPPPAPMVEEHRPTRRPRKTQDPKPAVAHFRLRVPYPARGTCAEFDRISETYGEEAAIQAVFKRAFDAWVEDFQPARTARLDTEYARGDKIFATSRIIRSEIIEAVAKAIDPLGIRTKTYIAERIGRAAMKSYIAAP